MSLPYAQSIALLCLSALSLNAAQLAWDRTRAEVELAPDQTEARARFTATNVSAQELQISKVETSCGCTGSIVNQERLLPGESSEIIATFHRGKRQSGGTNQLKVFLDQAQSPAATLQFKVELATPIQVSPQVVYWNASSSRSERSVRVTLDPRYAQQIQAIEYDADKMTVSGPEAGKSDGALVLRIQPKAFDQLLRETITLRTGGDAPSANAKIHVFVQP